MVKLRTFSCLALLLITLTVAACTEAAPPQTATSVAVTPTLPPLVTETADVAPTDIATAVPTEPAVVDSGPPGYVTPPQQEGPYYPVDKPAERDNDLVELAGATAPPAGEVLLLSGVIYDRFGMPVEGATIEIWQTDNSGVYDHPGDPGTDQRDPNFQFFGEAVTGVDGVYSFRTIIPGRYEPRPRHIHVKVRRGGEEVLTTQFYFGNEVSFAGAEVHLLIGMAPGEDDAGNPVWIGERDIVLSSG